MGSEVVLSAVKRPKREANHSSASSAEVNGTWSYTSIQPEVCMA
jgi:hypothetical protein